MLALKEWSIICKALEDGNQTILLRKGGILEYKKGFEIRQKSFLLFPTLEHQTEEYLQSKYLQTYDLLLRGNKSEGIQNKTNTLWVLARIEAIQEFHDHEMLPELEKYHIWNEKYVKMRMNYNPKKPMNALLLRVYKLPQPISIDINPEWAGCKSWIDIDIAEKYGNQFGSIPKMFDQSEPVIKDKEFQRISKNFMEIWN
ncbi:MAG: DUF1802 family protein [Nitrososphaeraceae archaeon]|jgi:hypothetical protein|nr:DUF1802 family protein [Nitrososphaeraceae archaeon]MDW0156158.1 DUF1802 family protein [Nitrososphaeraceae archaeon]